jgi:hypothetical protein
MFVGKQIELEIIMLSEINQIEKGNPILTCKNLSQRSKCSPKAFVEEHMYMGTIPFHKEVNLVSSEHPLISLI